jgi:hypothetical protein
MRKLLILLITFFCPGIIFFLNEQYGKMIIAFALQISIIGWVPTIIWARRSWKKSVEANTPKPRIKRTKIVDSPTPPAPVSKPNSEESV